jgi:hypothetical protein
MPFAVAFDTHFCLATGAFAVLVLAPSRTEILMDVARLYPLSAALRWTVYSVLRHVFFVFLVPQLLEGRIKQFVNMSQGDVVRRATPRRHMLRIGDGHFEDSFQTSITHAMGACQSR